MVLSYRILHMLCGLHNQEVTQKSIQDSDCELFHVCGLSAHCAPLGP